MREVEICKCPCHVKGSAIMHMFPCCDFTYKKYLNEDGSFDQVAYDEAMKPEKPKKRKHMK